MISKRWLGVGVECRLGMTRVAAYAADVYPRRPGVRTTACVQLRCELYDIALVFPSKRASL
jgi:hypothetical protein